MSFGRSVLGSWFEYGEWLPRRIQRVLVLAFAAALLVAPKPMTAALLDWSTQKAHAITDSIVKSLPDTPSTTTSMTAP